jgi:hypothetical protein
MEMSEETTALSTTVGIDEEPHIYEFTAIYGSYHILSDRLYLYIVTLLSAVWLFAQWRGHVARDLNAGCWYGWDALGLASVVLLGHKRKWALACVFTSSYFVWTRLPGSPFDSFSLPSFGTFLKASTQANSKVAEAADSQPECIVCWSSDEIPALLPCNHMICSDCLTAMKDRQQTHCPMCRLRLFHVNDGIQVAIHKAAAAALGGKLTAKGIHLILQLWHGQYWEIFTSGITYLLELCCFHALRVATQKHGINWWRVGLFGYLLAIPLPETRFGRSVWPAVVFVLLYVVGILVTLEKVGELDLVMDKVVHRKPLPRF